jgi:hypothetical protein
MEKTAIKTQCAYEDAIERELAAGHTSGKITDEAFKLSHLVQAGRRVSKDEMLEVEKAVKGPQGFLFR